MGMKYMPPMKGRNGAYGNIGFIIPAAASACMSAPIGIVDAPLAARAAEAPDMGL